ncbi:type IX secretion/gliding motility protein PorT/SprT [Flavobacterium frigidarium]|jgi:hypothetical protein|uniref:Porin family protein n=1 Tax=Flavobacterium frigidarium TaxID=99286 RepID=A0ABV4KF90_9FLAO
MKKIFLLILLSFFLKGNAQYNKSIFGKNPIINLENFQSQPIHFGFYLGTNLFDYKIDYKEPPVQEIQTLKSTGFNVGIIGDLRLQEYLHLRFEPGLYYSKREFVNPDATTSFGNSRELIGTYIHLPLLVKFSALRAGNVRPYLEGGFSGMLNLSSNQNASDLAASEERLRLRQWTFNYELGVGIDIFTEYFIFSPSVRGVFGIGDELIHYDGPGGPGQFTNNIDSIKNRAILLNFTFH